MFWDEIFSNIDLKFGDVDEAYLSQIRVKYKIK